MQKSPEAGETSRQGNIMCTVTLVARRSGYLLGMNRDEQRSRVAGLGPGRWHADGLEVVGPREPGGGTWIGCNAAGVTFALINWYAMPNRAEGPGVSRGRVTLEVLGAADADRAAELLAGFPLRQVRPFRLIGVFPVRRDLIEWRWDGRRLEAVRHLWATATWISSGHDEQGAERTRRRVFVDACAEVEADGVAAGLGVEWLRRLHGSHAPECGPYSHCMHRDDAVTVSYTEIEVENVLEAGVGAGGSGTAWRAAVRHRAGSPCGGGGSWIEGKV